MIMPPPEATQLFSSTAKKSHSIPGYPKFDNAIISAAHGHPNRVVFLHHARLLSRFRGDSGQRI
jgi:hypothetical protein